MIFFLFFQENQFWHFMQIVSKAFQGVILIVALFVKCSVVFHLQIRG